MALKNRARISKRPPGPTVNVYNVPRVDPPCTLLRSHSPPLRAVRLLSTPLVRRELCRRIIILQQNSTSPLSVRPNILLSYAASNGKTTFEHFLLPVHVASNLAVDLQSSRYILLKIWIGGRHTSRANWCGSVLFCENAMTP